MGKRKLFFGAWMDMRAKNNRLPKKKVADGVQLYNKINSFDLASWSSKIYFGPLKIVSVFVYFEDQLNGHLKISYSSLGVLPSSKHHIFSEFIRQILKTCCCEQEYSEQTPVQTKHDCLDSLVFAVVREAVWARPHSSQARRHPPPSPDSAAAASSPSPPSSPASPSSAP